jgi:hypothetical protein
MKINLFPSASERTRFCFPVLTVPPNGPAVDPDTDILYVNSNEMAWTAYLFEDKGERGAKAIYLSQCAVCHGENMRGAPSVKRNAPNINFYLGVTQLMFGAPKMRSPCCQGNEPGQNRNLRTSTSPKAICKKLI